MYFIKPRHFLWLTFCFAQLMRGQIKPEYDQLNSSLISSGFWYPQALKQRAVPDGSSYEEIVDAKECASLYSAFFQARIDSNLTPLSYDEFRREMREGAIAEKVIPISILDITYHDFKPSCFEENLLNITNGKVAHVESAIGNPFQEKECLVLWVDMSHVRSGANDFVLRESLYLTNRNEAPVAIEIDFDDGQGFRLMEFNEPISIAYSDINSDKIIRLRVERSDESMNYAAMKSIRNFMFFPCDTSPFPFPNLPPWPSSVFGDWSIQSEYLGDLVYGNAYTLYSEDMVFDKPFIFVEGVDFGVNDDGYPIYGDYQNGNFGWCEFSSGFFDPDTEDEYDYPYDNLKLMPELLHELRDHGYDLILLDFYDGAEEMRKNAQLLKYLINLCNEYKTGNESLVVAGASMGGQITRYALRSMELEGVDHCTRLWISMDSPHKGANIPIAMQKTIEFLCDLGKEPAIIFREKYLKRPAARQMLNDQVFSDLGMRDAWYNELDEMGFPEDCKRVAIANGSLLGVPQETNLEPLLDWECGSFDQLEIITRLHHMGGNEAVTNYLGQKQLGHIKLPTVGLSNISLWDLIFGLDLLDLYNVQERKFWKTDDKPNWDYAAGGKRNSIGVLAGSLNNELSNFLIDIPCGLIGESDFNDFHSFVSTASALALDVTNPDMNLMPLLGLSSYQSVFNNYHGPDHENQEHVEITYDNLNFILEEVLCWEYSGLQHELTHSYPNDGSFNYGKPTFSEIRSIDVHDGGELFFNANELTHFAGIDDIPALSGNKKYFTSMCSPAHVRVYNDGLISLGDELDNSFTAEVHIYRDSKVIIEQGGVLRINEGSKLVIHEGAELYLEPGGLLELNNGRIEVLAGGVMYVFGNGLGTGLNFGQNETIHSIRLNGNDACISFNNGKLELSDNVTMQFDTSVDETGYIEILPGSQYTLQTSVGSKLVFNGKNQDDVVLRINNFAHLQNEDFMTGSLVFSNCKVDLNNFGAIYTDLATTIEDVTFVANEMDLTHGGNVVVWYNNCMVRNSTFHQVKLGTRFTKLSAHDSWFYGSKSGIEAINGAYELKGNSFDLATVRSEGLQYASSIESCLFNDGIESQVKDKSLVELAVKGCVFSNSSEFGIEKKGGKLSALCNAFADVYGVKIEEGELNMSSHEAAGYNVFNQTDQCIYLVNAQSVDLEDGYNDFSGFEYFYIKGTVNMPCGEGNCFPEIDARGNCWGYTQSAGNPGIPDALIQPDPQYFDVTTSIVVPCAGYENTNACTVSFTDYRPAAMETCPEKVKLKVRSKSNLSSKGNNEVQSGEKSNSEDPDNPLLNTFNFNGILLDSALVYAAMMSEAYDTLGNDAMAVELLHEILTSGLDFSDLQIRSKMNWARYVMKSCVERMFMRGELHETENVATFEMPVQQYVDVLNLMTDTELTDSTYRDQFYLELDKGQLFRTIGNRQTALLVFEHLDDCQLDSLEQSVLYEWQQRTLQELDVNNQYLVMNVPPDSIVMADTSASENIFSVTVSDYYFGLWIDSPQNVTFVACGDHPVYRDLWMEGTHFGVFPNPSQQQIQIVGLEDGVVAEAQVWDLQGRKVYHAVVSEDASVIQWPEDMAAGSYILRIQSNDLTEDHLLMISR
jgi:hypothetical protein